MFNLKWNLVFWFGAALVCDSALGEVKPASLFSDGAVLQQGMEVPVWGTAVEGETVTVTVDGHKGEAVTKNGKWMVRLPALKAGGPFSMTIQGANTLTIQNVMVGEVWVCSGQSNMAFNLSGAQTAGVEIPAANYPKLRMFTVGGKPSFEPKAETTGSWIVCSPQSAKGFSAVGYFFGRDVHKATNLPVGMIHTSVSGTPAQAWTSLDGLEQEPELAHYVAAIQSKKAGYPEAKKKFEQEMADYTEALKKWKAEVGDAYNDALIKWGAENNKAKAAGQPEIPKPTLSIPAPTKPADPEAASGVPTVLYNGKVAPLVPYAIQGVVWYQGESNGGKEYRTLFPRLITDWREKWGQGDFPFFFVQIAPYGGMKPEIREAQLLTWQKVPNTAMVVTTDVGNPEDIHPKHKEPVGTRLALAARALVYGEKLEFSGPVYDTLSIAGDQAVVSFKHIGGGLVSQGGELKGFTIAGADRKFVPAVAKIAGATVVVSSSQVPAPVAVRYGWANVPEVNLYNKEALPASPFRTDLE